MSQDRWRNIPSVGTFKKKKCLIGETVAFIFSWTSSIFNIQTRTSLTTFSLNHKVENGGGEGEGVEDK